ncbi:MAG TPA: sialidase family protein [Acidimicrobiales bacterium]|nr:sialidase family protein [Acidimicrobiales bacterium]
MAAALLAVVGPAGAADDARPGKAVRVTDTPVAARTFEGPAAAVDPTDDRRVFLAATDMAAEKCLIYRSVDRGATFGQLDGPDFRPFTDCGLNKAGISKNLRQRLVFDPEGVLYWVVAVADPAAMGGRSIVLARSTDAGDTWTTTVVARAPIPADPVDAVANFVPDLFVNRLGDAPRMVWVSWRRSYTPESRKGTEGWAAASTDGGRTFGPEVRGLTADPGFDAPRVVVDADGAAYWFQRERLPRPPQGEAPKPARLLMARSTDGGRTWTEGDVGQSSLVLEEPLAAVSKDGRTVYLAWEDTSNGDLDLFFKSTTDGGRTWAQPVRVNDDPVGNKRTQKWPRMDVAPDGRIDLVWYDYRHEGVDTPDNDLEFYLGDINDAYYAWSDDGGKTFSPNVRATAESVNRRFGTYNKQYFVEVPAAVGSADDGVFVAWSDTRLANADTQAQDIFGAWIEVEDGGGGVSSRALLIAAEVALIVAGVVLLVLVARNRRKSVPSTG